MNALSIVTKRLKSTVSVDTIILHNNYNSKTYEKVTKYPRNIEGYVITSTNNKNTVDFALSVRKDGYDEKFLHVDFFKYNHGSTEYVSTYITISVNHFLFQHYNSLVVDRESIISKLEYLIRQLLYFPTFKLDRMSVSEVHICSDLILNHDAYHYLELLSHIPFKNYIAVHTNGNHTISLHSSTTKGVLLMDTGREPFEYRCKAVGSIYNKQKKLNKQFFDTAYNIIRFEFKFKEGKKNKLKHEFLNYEQVIGEKDEKGIKKFSDIFSVDFAIAITENMFEKHLFKYKSKELDDLITRQHDSQSRKYLTMYSNVDTNRDDHEYHIHVNNATTKKEKDDITRNYKNYKYYNFLKCAGENVPNSNVKYFDLYKELCEKATKVKDVSHGLTNCYRLYSYYSPHYLTKKQLPRYENVDEEDLYSIIHDH